jgi:polyhydroxybutyrate depolymerase
MPRVCRRLAAKMAITSLVFTFGARPLNAQLEVLLPPSEPGTQARRFLLHLPSSVNGPGPVPFVLGFHGGFGSAESFSTLTSLHLTGETRGFGVAYLDAGDGVWGDYRPGPGQPDADLNYVRSVIDYLVANHHADDRRIYATGISNGAAFSFVLAAQLADRVAAVAPVAHNLTQAFVDQATPSSPVHILQIVGTADPLMPFNGGTQGTGDQVLSSAASMQYWQAINGNGASTAAPLPNLASDATAAFRETFAPSPDGIELERVVVVNGGHTWPGGDQYLPVSTIGLTSRDFNANDLIWDFFAPKSLPIPAASPAAALAAGVVALNRRRRGHHEHSRDRSNPVAAVVSRRRAPAAR